MGESSSRYLERLGRYKAGQFLLLGGPLLFVLGAILLGYGAWGLYEAEQSASWPAVEGEIVSAGVVAETGRDHKTVYRPRVEYRYRVGDQEYSGDRISYSGAWAGGSDRHAVERTVARYVPGTGVRVYHDPTAPDRSVLEPGVSSGNVYVLMGLGGVLSLAGLVLLLALFLTRPWQGRWRGVPPEARKQEGL